MQSFSRPVVSFLFGLVSCLAAGCGDDPPAPSSAYDVIRYDLTGEYDWSRDRLAATVAITLTTLEADIGALAIDSGASAVISVRADGGVALPFTVDAEARQVVVDISGLPDRGEGARLLLTIDYEAAPGDWLRAVPARAGDPADARALYTFSEPLGAASWMPCHNRPDDRAFFSVEMRMDQGEKMIANGDLELDEADGSSGRRMKYATQYPLPTYLMAFAISDFEIAGTRRGDLPIAVWHRPGVEGDYEGLLAELDRQMGVFEPLLGPYPFEKYALVMLPEFSGGMEHASITFQTEIGTAQPSLAGDISLTAHELGHQWYGDLVTVATWDDVWIKEGMATLLSAESARAHEDEGTAGTLFGNSFYVVSGEAIRDTSLAPAEKYNTGPYDRAAWLFTQIRSVIGEDAFWGALRGILEDRRFGVVGTEDVLAAFAPHLGPDAAAAARRAVDARALPAVTVAPSQSGGALVTLDDPEGILVAPVQIEWHREDGLTERETLVPGEPMELRRNAEGDFLVLDPADVHPSLWLLLADEASAESYGNVTLLQRPGTPAQLARFSELAGAHQLTALEEAGLPPVTPDAFPGFVPSLHAESAKALSLEAACTTVANEVDPLVKDAWIPVLTGALTGAPYSLGLAYTSYSTCSELVSPLPLFASEWSDLKAGLTTPTISESRLFFLSRFDLPQPDALDAWGNATRSGYSLRARAVAARQLRRYAGRTVEAAPEDLPAWRSLVIELLGSSEASEVLRQVIPAVLSLWGGTPGENAEPLAALAGVLRSPATRGAHASAVCAAFALSGGDPAAWAAFVRTLDGARIAEGARTLLANPAKCQ